MYKKYRPWLRSFSGLFTNLSAGWFGLAFIAPNFAVTDRLEIFILLTKYITFGIVFLLASGIIERILEYEPE